MECRLIPLMIEMRFAGVRIDIDRAEQARALMLNELRDIDNTLRSMVGFEVNTNAAESLARAFDSFGIPYGRTAKSNKPSFKKEYLETIDHPLPKLVLKKRAREKLIGTFIEGY